MPLPVLFLDGLCPNNDAFTAATATGIFRKNGCSNNKHLKISFRVEIEPKFNNFLQ
jgi:hypothetical protein